MKKNTFASLLLLLFVLFHSISSFSQENDKPTLFAIEDSLSGRLILENDSTWINTELNFKKSLIENPKFYQYILVKIGKKNWVEGPHAQLIKLNDSIKYQPNQYGDSLIILFGLKVPTYIGNSSWGFYYTYHLIRKDKILEKSDLWYSEKCQKGHYKGKSNPCDKCYELNAEINDSLILSKIESSTKYQHWEPNTCEHGWDARKGQPCALCMKGIKLKQDSINKESEVLSIDSLKKIKVLPAFVDVYERKNSKPSSIHLFQEHLVTNYRGSLKGFRTMNEDSVWLNKQLNFLRNGSHIDSLIYYELIEVKKTYFIENDTNPEFVSPKQNNPLKSPFSSGVKSKYGDSIIQFEGGKNYSQYGIPLKGYVVEYTLKRTSYLVRYKFKNCSHSQVCCSIKCHQCEKPKPILLKRITFDSVPLMVIDSDCDHGHDCCSMECECCSSLTKKKRKQLIRSKKKRHRKGQRATRRDERKKRNKKNPLCCQRGF